MVGTTSIRVSRQTLEDLERLRERLSAGSLDETIQLLIKKQRRALVGRAFSLDSERVKPFAEEDRGEDRS